MAADDLADVRVHGGTVGGSETMWVRAFDGTECGAWDSFSLTTLPNSAPEAAAGATLKVHEGVRLRDLVSAADADGHAITAYQIYDSGLAGDGACFSSGSGARYQAGYYQTLTAAEFDAAWLHGGSAAGTDTMAVRVFDGTSWSAWNGFQLTTLLM